MADNKFQRGSEWRKWDLHFHTQSSFDYANKSVTDDEIISRLLKSDIRVVAITDHHIIDVDRILNLRKIGDGKITILPGIELRSELGGSESIHFIGIFPESIDVSSIWIKLQGLCALTVEDIKKKGDEKIYCDFKETAKLIKSYGGLISVHAGNKTNTIENITNSLSHKMALKEDLIEYIDIYEIGSESDQKGYIEKVFPHLKKRLPMIICSDNHNILDFKHKQYLWIKADPTFNGLRQIIHEPEERVFIGNTPPKLVHVNNNKGLFVDKLEIITDNNANIWFDNTGELYLNTGLISIIGNKGSGKSALADILSLSCNSVHDIFSFLNKDKFLKLNLSKKYSANVHLKDGFIGTKKFVENKHMPNLPCKAVYLSQSFVNKLCDNIDISFLQKEINRVIFSHIPKEERYGKNEIEELLTFKSKLIEGDIDNLNNKLMSINDAIVDLEKYQKKEFKEKYQNELKELVRQLDHIKTNEKPDKVEPPTGTDQKALLEMIGTINHEKDAVLGKKQTYQTELELITKDKQVLEIEKGEIQAVERQINDVIEKYSINETFTKYKLDIRKIVQAKIDYTALDQLVSQIKAQYLSLRNEIHKCDTIIIDKEKELKVNQDKLTGQQKQYQAYLDEVKKWEGKQIQLLGDRNTVGTIEHCKTWIKYIDENVPVLLATKYAERTEISKQMLGKKYQLKETLEDIYRPAQNYANEKAKEYNIKEAEFVHFESKISFSFDFENTFLDFIARNKKGSFYGGQEGYDKINSLKRNINLDNKIDSQGFPDFIIEHLRHNITADPTKSNQHYITDIDSQIKVGKNKNDLYNYLYSFEYLDTGFSIKYDNKPIQLLSPGEKGYLLILFYMLIDKDVRPIIVDQPEENLDNETVFRKLVPILRRLKDKRQVIIVTHNANLAVVCDSEQIIHAQMDKENNYLVNYDCGSIEYSNMRDNVVNILEGTEPAFKNRKEKYNIH
jgi:hypothetical protein